MLIAAGAFNPSVTIARCHGLSLSQLSTVSAVTYSVVMAAIYGAARDENNSESGTYVFWHAGSYC
jgi:hypothetical protein